MHRMATAVDGTDRQTDGRTLDRYVEACSSVSKFLTRSTHMPNAVITIRLPTYLASYLSIARGVCEHWLRVSDYMVSDCVD